MFRAKRKSDNTYVYGWLFQVPLTAEDICDSYYSSEEKLYQPTWVIAQDNCTHEIIPSTISMKTFQKDKNGEDIYGSFMLDGYRMTEGGDRVKHDAGDIWNVCIEDKEIDGYQCTGFWGFCKSEHNKIEIIKQENK